MTARRWVAVVLAVAGLAVVGLVLVGRGPAGGALPGGAAASSGELTGQWSGEGKVTQCAGFDRCAGTRRITLTIDCAGKRCRVVPFATPYGRPPLRFAGGHYRAVGPLPPGAAPTCAGAPTTTARWRLDLIARGGKLLGSYAESTVQSFDCGATGLAWDVVLERA